MEAGQLTTLKRIAEFVKAPPHRIIHVCERGLVRPVVPAEGRGTVRKFDRENTFRIVLALYLEDLGLQHDLIRLLMDGIDELLKTSEIKDRIDPTVDVDAAAIFDRLGDYDNPAMGLVVLQNSGERLVQFVIPKGRFMHWQSGSIHLTSMPFQSMAGSMAICVAVNLTWIAKLII